MTTTVRSALLLLQCTIGSVVAAQTLPPVQRLGSALNTSSEGFAAVSQVRALPGGRLLVNDNRGRRVVLLDSTLRTLAVVADTTGATAHAYGSALGGLIAYRGDSTLFVDPTILSMLLIDANGKIVRTMAVPQPNEVNYLIGGPFGTPGLDPQGRLVYQARVGGLVRIARVPDLGQRSIEAAPDSAMVVRFNLSTRSSDTVAKFEIPSVVTRTTRDENRLTTVTTTINPIPWTDDWALLSDGTVAIVHGRDYRVDFIGSDGPIVSTPRLPFEWRRLSDSEKTAIIDSARTVMEEVEGRRAPLATPADSAKPQTRRLPPPESTLPTPSHAPAAAPAAFITRATDFVSLDQMPDYRPPFRQGAARGDSDGNLWVRTSNVVNSGVVYDVISRKGTIVARVQIPPGRVIAGFGSGEVIYMGAIDGATVRLERARAVIGR